MTFKPIFNYGQAIYRWFVASAMGILLLLVIIYVIYTGMFKYSPEFPIIEVIFLSCLIVSFLIWLAILIHFRLASSAIKIYISDKTLQLTWSTWEKNIDLKDLVSISYLYYFAPGNGKGIPAVNVHDLTTTYKNNQSTDVASLSWIWDSMVLKALNYIKLNNPDIKIEIIHKDPR
ncbi:hypothetical protein A3A14_03630 [Candidatus Daviesbacteria bacterium RIFCSPLOWO2_01_FULL_43_38]|uniref:Uncharacterized protein n=2 Tax=Candidatus Daviesiibacteriota TaxID=1752718 RepID=A0A1F5K8D3_9BACT|nr:MAG: hypothetical protein UV41_C0028G0008 [Candidatus Daviesbacteria bacterium GW2011_GWA2_42_7]OGE20425.1 MAG: hypothetical protein A2874_00380 [Candidatus Daviesbacteria bacterium RIFCSPHIGHO2_01_FULL_43_17]OGE37030.1 MAG: hypothetical protein A3E45_02170 [Candidatus Daviesbacteria bacterium RIFCSPHIGHO2_12_FULL_43_11]OGE63901.1 MAG: hypothetical protein A3A14_03630 [Candidatus Daviesbacteria bacterium RIFCSPLOWO2_01_FULL_43_38]OGE70700.1 MAG: hypothetical protein A3J21_03565 [Candidatus D